MNVERLQFTRNWENMADYPTVETSEVQVRKDIQSLYTEIQTYLNTVLVPALEALGNSPAPGGVVIPSDVLRKSGGTMVGPLYLARTPVEAKESATKAYVDDQVGLTKESAEEGLAALSLRAGKIESTVVSQQGSISQLIQRSNSLESLVQSAQGELSELKQTAGEISLSVTEQTASDGTVTAKITLSIGPNQYSGYVRLTGNVDVSGQLSAQALYAAQGDIAALTVDGLSTSRRVVKYLSRDQSDDNFIRLRDKTLEFVSGVYAGGYSQAQSPEGLPLWWEDRVYESAEVTLGEDGYPWKQGVRIFTTTVPTDYPVYIYRYQEVVKQSFRFETDTLTGDYAPLAIFGAGDDTGANWGYLRKRRTGLDLKYLPPRGAEIGLHMGSDGYLELQGLRRTEALDFSRLSEGIVTETLSGGEVITYTLTFTDGDLTKITDSSGHETAVTWKEGGNG